MSNIDVTAGADCAPRSKIRLPKKNLPSLMIDGEEWKPRKNFADDVGICDVSVKRMNLRTTYVGGVAYVCVQEGLQAIAGRAKRREEAPTAPPVRRRHQR